MRVDAPPDRSPRTLYPTDFSTRSVEPHRDDVYPLHPGSHPPGGDEHVLGLLIGDLISRIGMYASLDLDRSNDAVDAYQ